MQTDNDLRFRELILHLSSLWNRIDYNLEFEQVIKGIVEEFTGQTFPAAGRLLLRDKSGELYGVPGAEVEFDLYVHNGSAYLVEFRSHLKPNEVLEFYQRVKFAERELGRSIIPLVIALSMAPRSEARMRELGIKYRIGAGGVVATSPSG